MKKKTKNTILNILIFILFAVVLFSGYKVYTLKSESVKNATDFQKLSELVNFDNTGKNNMTPAEKYYNIYEENNDFVGWIKIPDTGLNYPVMQTKNQPEYYLRRNFEKNYSYAGTPFADYRCDIDESDNIVLYAHNMKDKTMFSTLLNYEDPQFLQEHKYIYFDTMNSYGKYEVVCSFRIDTANSDFHYNDVHEFANENEFNSFINNAKNLSTYNSEVEASFGDKLITLSTCEYTIADGAGRYVVIAKRVEQ